MLMEILALKKIDYDPDKWDRLFPAHRDALPPLRLRIRRAFQFSCFPAKMIALSFPRGIGESAS